MNLLIPPLPKGVTYTPTLFDHHEAVEIQSTLTTSLPWNRPRVFLWGRWVRIPRDVCWFGPVEYRYSNHLHLAAPMPPAIETICARVEQVSGFTFNAVLCNRYDDESDSVDWHSDDDYQPSEHGAIASVSFGCTRRFDLRHKSGRPTHSIDLEHGSLLLMGPGVQYEWEHRIPKTSHAYERINLTFRNTA